MDRVRRNYLQCFLSRKEACQLRGLPKEIRTDSGKEFCGKAMLICAYRRGVTLFLIAPRKPKQNPYIESFNGRFRFECLNEKWFTSLAHARVLIETWRQEYNEERPTKSRGSLTPMAYARQLTPNAVISPPYFEAECD